jgi:hypothetical protein
MKWLFDLMSTSYVYLIATSTERISYVGLQGAEELKICY